VAVRPDSYVGEVVSFAERYGLHALIRASGSPQRDATATELGSSLE
jgi:hypothetical protein